MFICFVNSQCYKQVIPPELSPGVYNPILNNKVLIENPQ